MQFTGPGSVLRLPANRLGSFPPVSLTAHWSMKAGLYSPFQSAAHTVKEEPFIFPSHRPHTQLPPLSSALSIHLFSSLYVHNLSLCLQKCLHAIKEDKLNLWVQQMFGQTEAFWFPFVSHTTAVNFFSPLEEKKKKLVFKPGGKKMLQGNRLCWLYVTLVLFQSL